MKQNNSISEDQNNGIIGVMRRFCFLAFFIIFVIIGVVLFFGAGIRFGNLKCNKFSLKDDKAECGPAVEFKNGVRKYVVIIDSVNYLDKGLEVNYFYKLSDKKWWSKYIYIRSKGIFYEDKEMLAKLKLVSNPVVEFLPENMIYDDFLTAEKFKNFILEKFDGKVNNKEIILTLEPPFNSFFWQKNRINNIVEIIFAK